MSQKSNLSTGTQFINIRTTQITKISSLKVKEKNNKKRKTAKGDVKEKDTEKIALPPIQHVKPHGDIVEIDLLAQRIHLSPPFKD